MIDVAVFLCARYAEEEEQATDDPCRCPAEFSAGVARRVAAHRRLVEYAAAQIGMDDLNDRGSHGMVVLLMLAQPYAQHPDFRPEWSV